MRLTNVEQQLRKRLAYPYKWHRRQNDTYDELTKFVYANDDFDITLEQIDRLFSKQPDFETKRDYALNRWFNYWSAQAIEHIFGQSTRVVRSANRRNRRIDFAIDAIDFDHKTSIFPQGYGRSLRYAQQHPRDLIQWLYLHQSQQQRLHLNNRLFLVLYANDGQHWKLKAEIMWLQGVIERYLQHFSADKLHRFSFASQSITVSDILWGVH